MSIERKPATIIPFEDDRAGLIREVEILSDRMEEACHEYINGTNVVHLSEQAHGQDGIVLGWNLGLDLKDLVLLAAICQAPLAFRSGTDRGKTTLAELALNGLFGTHGEEWWRVEISRGMNVDDLIDVDIKKLTEAKLSEAVSSAPWLSYPGRLLDEINRAPAKLNNILLHIVDGSGLHVRGNLHIPVGKPYTVRDEAKRYSFSIATANEQGGDYDGVYAEDMAMLRRIVLSVNLDDVPPTTQDTSQLLRSRRPKITLRSYPSMADSVIRIYESLTETIPVSPLGLLFLHYLSGLGTCVRTRSGRLRPVLQPEICQKCHLSKSHRFCGRVGGLSEGLLLWTRDIASGIAALRAAKVLKSVREDCLGGRTARLQEFLGLKTEGEALYEAFRNAYLAKLSVTGEDIVATYTLIAPNHVFIDENWLGTKESYEKSQTYAFTDVGNASWSTMQGILRSHKQLFADLVANAELSPANQAEVEALVTTEDAAMLSVIAALRDKELPLKFREALALGGRTTLATQVA